MSYVSATPQALADAAGNLAEIGSTIRTANATAAAGTAGVKAPGGDAVSAFLSALFAVHAQTYQAARAQAASYHDQFVQTLRAGAGAYASAEAANASPLEKVGGMVSATSHISAGHLEGNGANGAMGTGHQGGVGGPLNGNAPISGPGADGRAAAIGGPQDGNASGGGANGVPAGDGGGSGGRAGGAASGGGGGAGEVADPGGARGGPGSASGAGAGGAAAASVPTAWGPAGPVAPVGPLVPGLATAPGAPPVMAGGYPATAGLAGLGGLGGGAFSGDSPAIGGLGEAAAPAAYSAAASPVAASPAAEPALATATKAQPVHPGNPARPDDAAHPGHPAHPAGAHHDKAALFLPLSGLRGLRRKLQQRSALRDPIEWRKELREAAITKPWGRDELLGVLGLRPPGSE